MSDDRKSMDDVLASIRRIVRTESQDADAGEPDGRGREGFVQENDAEEPLILAPEMRIDLPAEPGAEPADVATELDADIVVGAGSEAALPDPEALRAMLRDLLREELGHEDPRNAVREIVRDELVHGEIGENISQNVLRLIREEVRRAVGER